MARRRTVRGSKNRCWDAVGCRSRCVLASPGRRRITPRRRRRGWPVPVVAAAMGYACATTSACLSTPGQDQDRAADEGGGRIIHDLEEVIKLGRRESVCFELVADLSGVGCDGPGEAGATRRDRDVAAGTDVDKPSRHQLTSGVGGETADAPAAGQQ